MKIIVTEIQKFEDGTMTTPSFAYENINDADAKYHSILASAAKSALPVHACIMFDEQGCFRKSEYYTHDAHTTTD